MIINIILNKVVYNNTLGDNMKIIAIILFTVAAVALIVLITSGISLIRTRDFKKLQHGVQGPFYISLLITMASLVGGITIWMQNNSAAVAKNTTPAVEKQAQLPGANKASSTKKTPSKQQGTMNNTFSNAKQYAYADLIKSDALEKKPYALNQAQIVQTSESNGHPFALVFDTTTPANFYIIVFKDKQTYKVGDQINASGILGKRTSYKTNSGQQKTVPTLYALQAAITGQGTTK